MSLPGHGLKGSHNVWPWGCIMLGLLGSPLSYVFNPLPTMDAFVVTHKRLKPSEYPMGALQACGGGI